MSGPQQTAFADQYRAAVADVGKILGKAAQDRRTPGQTAPRHTWLTTRFRTLADRLRTGTARACPHLGDSPQATFAAAWATDRIVCSRCIGLLHPDPAEDARCDRCGRVTDAPCSGFAAQGPVLMAYGLCTPCAHKTGLAAEPTTQDGPGPTDQSSTRSRRPFRKEHLPS